ncbi:hypothetical protein ACVNPS_08910 [Candidatus Bipolaricaulota sp. J31]
MYEPFDAGGRRWQRYAAAMTIILVIAGLTFLYLWLNARVIVLRRDLATLSLEIRDLEKKVLSLEYHVNEAFSLERLEAKAVEFGMVPLPEDHVIRLRINAGGDND